MINKIFLSIILFSNIIATSQEVLVKKINLNWIKKETMKIDKNTSWKMPIVKDNGVDTDNNTPLFIQKWQVNNDLRVLKFTLKNIIYKDLSKNDLYDIPLENIKDKLDPSFKILSTRDKSHAYISINPILINNNTIKQVLSFEIHYQLTKNTKNKKRAYVANSVLSSGDWYKFSVDTTGIYKIDKTFLENIGIGTKNLNPRKISIYGNGGGLLPYKIGDFRYDDLQENAIYVKGEADGKFDKNDYILFYAKGPESWTHEGSLETLKHKKNIYSNKAFYFLHVKNTDGKRVSTLPDIESLAATEINTYDDYIVHEIDRKNLFHIGQRWFGEAFDINNEQTISMRFDNLDTSSPVTIRTLAVASSSTSTTMNVKVNNQNLYDIALKMMPDKYTWATDKMGVGSAVFSKEDFNITLNYNNSGDASANAYLDYIEMIGKKKLIVNDKQFSFRNFNMIGDNSAFLYKLTNPSNIQMLWDVTDPINPKNINNLGSSDFTFKVQGGELHEYIIINSNDYYRPNEGKNSKISNQNLHGLSAIDYLIITNNQLTNEARQIADYHKNNSNLNTVVITLDQIYNEFGSGSTDITAIRDFVKFLYDTSSLQYVLMYGDTSYDHKNIFENSDNIVPVFESFESFSIVNSFVTDDFFAIVSDAQEGDLDADLLQTQDIAIARLPIRTISEAKAINAKIFNYYSEHAMGDWRNQIMLFADDPDSENTGNLANSQEALADEIALNKPAYNLIKVYADAYQQVISSGGAEYPEVNKAIINTIEKGVLIANYFGHGGEDGLAEEKILTNDNIENWTNFDRLPLLMIISCEFARFDNPSRPNTAGELVMRNPRGAGVHQIATARAVWVSTGDTLNHALIPYLLEYDGNRRSISENFRLVKNEKSAPAGKQRYFVFSFGDPAMKLAVPQPDIKITHMNDKPISQPLDTIKALSHVSFKGYVAKKNGEIDPSYNGVLTAIVFDKEVDKQTLLNDGIGIPLIFDTQESKVFRGSASVTNGTFAFDFVAPKDIRIAYGKAKLSFYANDTNLEKNGYNIDVTIGGINENAPEDNTGPVIQLYMNDKSFIDGGTTNQSPNLLAFFEDENGINTSLTSVDHDIVAVIDNDLQNPIILNDYYTTELNNYKKGNLTYRLSKLKVGLHTIHLKAYDTYNNKSEASLSFMVLDDSKLVLEHVLNYPNPFINYTEFWFNHNKPNEPLEAQIQIYTVSGKLIKTINKLVQTSGSLSRDISWDGLDDFGQKIGKGVYVYKLSVHATISNLKAEKFEKLVILQ